MSKTARCAFLLASVLWSIPRLAIAQTGVTAPDAASDTAVVRIIMQGVYGELGWTLASAAQDTTRRAWEIRFPQEDSVLWDIHRTNLFRIVRGSAPTQGDSSISMLHIRAIAFRRDTLVADFYLGAKWRCPDGRWTGSGTYHELIAVRHGTAWEMPRVTEQAFGDGVCLTRQPRNQSMPR